MPPSYAHAADVLRLFDPTLTLVQVRDGELGPNGEENIHAAISDAGSALENKTGHAWRERRVGGSANAYEYHASSLRYGKKVYLDHRDVCPLDPAEGDVIEIRTSRDRWVDILSSPSDWDCDYTTGILYLYQTPRLKAVGNVDNRNVRLSYRYGSLGGGQNRGGQATLDGSITADTTTISVNSPDRLPQQGVFLIDNKEYVSVDNVNQTTGALEGVSRARRNTVGQEHADGATVHYCPLDIRKAVAAKAALELLMYDDHVERLVEGRDTATVRDKNEAWSQTWERTLDKYAEVRAL